MNNRFLKFLVFAAVAGAAFFALQLLGHGTIAWSTLQESLKKPLESILATATGAAAALMVPPQPQPSVITLSDGVPSIPLTEYNRLVAELGRWVKYGEEMDQFTKGSDVLRSMLDTRQAVLRVSTYAILALAFAVSIAGFLGPSISQGGGTGPTAEVLFSHFGVIAIAVGLVGVVLGAVIYKIRVHTVSWQAAEAGIRVALVLNLSVILVSLPYTFTRMWNQQVAFAGLELPMIMWTTIIRLFLLPLLCMTSAFVGFVIARSLNR